MRALQAAALLALLFAAAESAAFTVPSEYAFLEVRYSGLPCARAAHALARPEVSLNSLTRIFPIPPARTRRAYP